MKLEELLTSREPITDWNGQPRPLQDYSVLRFMDQVDDPILVLPRFMPTFTNGPAGIVKFQVYMSLLAGMLDAEVLEVKADIEFRPEQLNLQMLTIKMDVNGKEIRDEFLADIVDEA